MKPARFDLAELKAAAFGRWPDIHAALSVPREYLNTRKHSPCPYCGGKDRYRYTDHQHSGGFICNQCTPQGGSGFDLLKLVFGYDFHEATRQVAALLGMAGGQVGQHQPRAPLPPAKPAEPPKDKQPALLQTWQEARTLDLSDPAALYLQGRGIPAEIIMQAENIRFHAALPLYAPRSHDSTTAAPLLIGHYPAMLAAIRHPCGSLQGLHKTYLSDHGGHWRKLAATHPETGEALPAKKMQARFPDALHGAAVHMAAPDGKGRLIVAEGIETAMAARALFGLPAVAALSAWGLCCFQWPPETRQLYTIADNDTNGTGRKAAHDLAVRAIKAGISAHLWLPDTAGFDALDEWNARRMPV